VPAQDRVDAEAAAVTGHLQVIAQALRAGDRDRVEALTRSALARRTEPRDILSALLAGMAVVGERFRDHEIFLPDVLLAARAMNAAMVLLKPLLVRDGIPTLGTIVLGTVAGDLHDVGKNLVGIMLSGAGFEVVDVGTDVPADRFVEAAVASGASVIGLSALLTTTMVNMQPVIDLIERHGLRGSVRTIVGGAPVTEAFAREVGADAYGFDAANAVQRVRALLDLS
jgi:5-methyltetrahydrofolate--homocysteine methyltransferase